MQPPNTTDSYIHRSGRTGRAGKTGICVTLFTYSKEDYLMGMIEKEAKIKFTPIKSKDLGPIVKPPPKNFGAWKGEGSSQSNNYNRDNRDNRGNRDNRDGGKFNRNGGQTKTYYNANQEKELREPMSNAELDSGKGLWNRNMKETDSIFKGIYNETKKTFAKPQNSKP